MTQIEIDFMNTSTLISIFLLGMFIGVTLSMLVAIYNENRRNKYEDRG